MGAADKEVAGAEPTDDLRRACDERHHAFGLSIGHLAPCYRPAATEPEARKVDLIRLSPAPRSLRRCIIYDVSRPD